MGTNGQGGSSNGKATVSQVTERTQPATATPSGSGSIPHGGQLVQRAVTGDEAADLRRRAQALPALQLSGRQVSDLDLIANGAFSPLEASWARADYATCRG